MTIRMSFFVLILAFFALSPSGLRAVTLDLRPDVSQGDLCEVSAKLEVGGSLKVRPEEQLQTNETENEDAPEKGELAMSVDAQLTYEELLLPGKFAEGATNLAARYYKQAEAKIKVEKTAYRNNLPTEQRLVVVQPADDDGAQFHCPGGHLQREHLDLITVVGDSLVVNDLLPQNPIAEDESWPHSAATMRALLALDSVAVCEVQSIVEKQTSGHVQIRLAGTVHGAADGAATELELRGIYLFDTRKKRVTHLNLAVKEKRSIGDATPGLDVVAKLRLVIKPLDDPKHLTVKRVASLDIPEDAFQEALLYHGRRQGFRLVHDANWYVTSEERESVTLRRIQQGRLVAHCTISRLLPTSEENQTSLAQFQKDISFALKNSFEEFVSSREWVNDKGHRCLKAVARGKVDDVPVEWHYYLVSPEKGYRASLAFTIEGTKVEQLGDADEMLVEGLELVEPSEFNPNSESLTSVGKDDEAEESPVWIAPKRNRNRSRSATRRGRPGRR